MGVGGGGGGGGEFTRFTGDLSIPIIDTCLAIFKATIFYEVFSGKQPCQDIKILRCFGD